MTERADQPSPEEESDDRPSPPAPDSRLSQEAIDELAAGLLAEPGDGVARAFSQTPFVEPSVEPDIDPEELPP